MNELITLGWSEWLALPDLNIPAIAAKIDTGARSSCLHAFHVEPFEKASQTWVTIGLHPVQGNQEIEIWRQAPVIDQRQVTDSGGHAEIRWVIQSNIMVGGLSIPSEITLTNRDSMAYRMLLGRTAMAGHILVDPEKRWLLGEPCEQKRTDTERCFADETKDISPLN